MKWILVKEIISLSLIVLILHVLALEYYLYWIFSWSDILMHFLGGFLIGIIVISIIYRFVISRQEKKENKILPNYYLLFSTVILGVLVVGLTWELWELFVGFTNIMKDRVDTIVDVIMDLIGGVFAIGYYYFKYSK